MNQNPDKLFWMIVLLLNLPPVLFGCFLDSSCLVSHHSHHIVYTVHRFALRCSRNSSDLFPFYVLLGINSFCLWFSCAVLPRDHVSITEWVVQRCLSCFAFHLLIIVHPRWLSLISSQSVYSKQIKNRKSFIFCTPGAFSQRRLRHWLLKTENMKL